MHPLFVDYLERLEALLDDMEQAFRGLPQAGLDWIPGDDMNSLAVLVVHTTGSGRYWMGDIAGGIPSQRDRAAEFRAQGLDEAALRRRMADFLAFAREFLASLSPDTLDVKRLATFRDEPVTAGWALLHALEHTALHVGHAQITRQLWDQRHG